MNECWTKLEDGHRSLPSSLLLNSDECEDKLLASFLQTCASDSGDKLPCEPHIILVRTCVNHYTRLSTTTAGAFLQGLYCIALSVPSFPLSQYSYTLCLDVRTENKMHTLRS